MRPSQPGEERPSESASPEAQPEKHRPGHCVDGAVYRTAGAGWDAPPGAGEEAFDEGGPILCPPEQGLDQGGELGEVAFGQLRPAAWFMPSGG
jgi:hypothetical protein